MCDMEESVECVLVNIYLHVPITTCSNVAGRNKWHVLRLATLHGFISNVHIQWYCPPTRFYYVCGRFYKEKMLKVIIESSLAHPYVNNATTCLQVHPLLHGICPFTPPPPMCHNVHGHLDTS